MHSLVIDTRKSTAYIKSLPGCNKQTQWLAKQPFISHHHTTDYDVLGSLGIANYTHHMVIRLLRPKGLPLLQFKATPPPGVVLIVFNIHVLLVGDFTNPILRIGGLFILYHFNPLTIVWVAVAASLVFLMNNLLAEGKVSSGVARDVGEDTGRPLHFQNVGVVVLGAPHCSFFEFFLLTSSISTITSTQVTLLAQGEIYRHINRNACFILFFKMIRLNLIP